MKARIKNFRLPLLMAAVIAGTMLFSAARTDAAASILVTVTGTTLTPNSATNTVSIFVQATATGLTEASMTLYMQVGDGGPWASGAQAQFFPGGTNTDGINPDETVPSGSDATAPGISGTNYGNGAGGFTNYASGPMAFKVVGPPASLMQSQTTTGTIINQPIDNNPAYAAGDQQPLYSQLAKTGVSFSGTAKAIPTTVTLLETVNIDTTYFSSGSFQLIFTGTDLATKSVIGATSNAISAPAVTLTIMPEPASLGFVSILLPAMLLRRRRNAIAASN